MVYATEASVGRSSDTVAEFVGTTKRYGAVLAASQLNLRIRRGEFLSFLGPSGCGKTTALRMLAGFEQPSEGEILIDGSEVGTTPAYKRPVNMVFQSYALFPHMTVAQNVAYGLRQRRPRLAKAEIALRVAKALETVRLADFGGRRIWEMSGGQQQRVALARAIVNEPKILLLDEPMAALDAKLRTEMQLELLSLQRELGITFVLVTHDQQEALSMSDRICIMGHGRIAQIGTPRELYDRPANRYVANFVGRANILAGKVEHTDGDDVAVSLASGHKVVVETAFAVAPGDVVDVMIRPEALRLTISPTEGEQTIEVQVANKIFLGEHIEFLLTHPVLGQLQVLVPRQAERALPGVEVGSSAHLVWDRGAGLILERGE
ncbi:MULTISPECIES: ABC transporter ATP-binding protein [Brucella/Ochrobactrum group]|uniref:Spermidine/putrescine import ATP-binding protein PotA n=1 Tax=Brucella anthropi (strain ATCC 49188 / DSM 6882 / CCUG 24695 / JCM 21032 / LMG 3331 / NBRC 15819 / NCTC 12168 / Alc 37) TaxID=439375 RepID=A6X8H0_BRUA4|nr:MULTISPECIES: ABC transporter ATP-binding protein [Brucella/Ochrobactrum group]ABS17524.1 spermidine/putrescine ABC transporter ATPase subunit [Brucella anthropi ATCC 49188]AIK41535.1 polyamine ABC transporter, ATP-binding family protein [Brucella anthropi]KAB2727858.1 ABC transporter ATP-binding protein [Brucella anthropi]KAB2746336.1 ABC transporter ATP-binding protein [Brucella anthropi]KAB2749217.1 ABC transporter ATP-binding protein [Brucella anthropi]